MLPSNKKTENIKQKSQIRSLIAEETKVTHKEKDKSV